MSLFPTFARTHRRLPTKLIVTTSTPMRGESDSESSKTFVLDQSLSAEGATAPGNSQAPWTLHRKNSGEQAS